MGYWLLEMGYWLLVIGYWLLVMDSSYLAFARTITHRARVRQLTSPLDNDNNIIQQHLRSHNATSAEKRGQLIIGSSYLAFARTITRRARVRQLTIDSWQLTVDS